ncbi:hypothetical protein I4U23_000441 [Adineta vaga]|nr:hypothetical protein I4U23_000441 [Adineta vaga]
MVLFYGLLALETANNTISSISERRSQSKKFIVSQHSTERKSSSSNSWIYTKDLQKHIDEHYLFPRTSMPERISPENSNRNNSWIYSRSIHNHIAYSALKLSSSTYYLSNQDQFTRKQSKYHKRSSSLKTKLITTIKHHSTTPLQPLNINPDPITKTTKFTRLRSFFSLPSTSTSPISNQQPRSSFLSLSKRTIKL